MSLSRDPGSLRDEDAIEPEIQQLQDQLRRVRKQRELLELRHALAEEQRLLEDVKYRLAASVSHTPTTAYQPPPTDTVPMNDAHPVHGIKRSHSVVSLNDIPDHASTGNTTQDDEAKQSTDQGSMPSAPSSDASGSILTDELSTGSEASESIPIEELSADSDALHSETSTLSRESSLIAPPELPIDKYFEITTRPAFRDFRRKLTNRFSKYSQDHRDEKWKVCEAERHLSDDLLAQWRATGREERWCEFHDVLLQKLPPRRRRLTGSIENMYRVATQREGQSVINYNSHLLDLEVEMPQLLDENDLIRKLHGDVLQELRNAWALQPRPHPPRYDDLVASLAATERSLPERVKRLEDKIERPRGPKRPRI